MELASEDTLRLNVLLANPLQAIRIHESSMTVYGLSDRGEAQIKLNPTGRDEHYLKKVREMLSGHVLGSPGGYPVYLKRWTRMGQTRADNLDQLLLLGEPEAVAAVVHARGLTDELARRAWWADPTSENARQMLKREAVRQGTMGKVLAEHLVEHLAFEDDPQTMIETVGLILQPELVDEATKRSIWNKGQRKNAYRVGFLMGTPDEFPETLPARADLVQHQSALEDLIAEGNPVAKLILRTLSGPGQTFIATSSTVLEKPFNQDVVNTLLETVADYFQRVRPPCDPNAEIEQLVEDAEILCGGGIPKGVESPPGLLECLRTRPELAKDAKAMLILARLGYPVVRPIFSRTTAIGTLMRKKLKPVTTPIFDQFAALRTACP